MPKIQINLSETEDKIVDAYKLVYGLKTKELAIRKMIKFFKVKIVPDNMNKSEEYYMRAINFAEDEK